MIKLIKRYFCKHKYGKWSYYRGILPKRRKYQQIWLECKCKKCGKRKVKMEHNGNY